MNMERLPKDELRWLGQAVWRWDGNLEGLEAALPVFAIEPLVYEHALNEYLSLIIREPVANDDRRVPVSTVSKRYALIQHRDAAGWLRAAFNDQGWNQESTRVTLWLSEYGERMRAEIVLPTEPVQVRKGDIVGARVLLWNSVDRSRAFELAIQWQRLICLNGMTIWNGDRLRKVHHLDWMSNHSPLKFLIDRLPRSKQLVEGVRALLEVEMTPETLRKWADKEVAKGWGRPRAARLWHILTTGHDCAVGRASNYVAATHLDVVPLGAVPGSEVPARNAYDVYQALIWLAGNERSIEQREVLLGDVVDLMDKLAPKGSISALSAV